MCEMEKSPEMTKTLAAKALHSEGELWSTSQQFLSLEIYLAFLFFFVHAHQAHARVKQPSAICLIQQGRQQGMEMQTRMPFVLLTALF